jgi:hypothetical protein
LCAELTQCEVIELGRVKFPAYTSEESAMGKLKGGLAKWRKAHPVKKKTSAKKKPSFLKKK